MGSAYLPTVSVERVLVGTTSVVNPTLLITVNGIAYSSEYRYRQRRFFATYQASTGNIYVTCHTTASTSDEPAYTVPNIGVLILG